MPKYKLTVVNQSLQSKPICIYQKPPSSDIHSFAWFTKEIRPGETAVYSWTPEYEISCSHKDRNSEQKMKVDPSKGVANSIRVDIVDDQPVLSNGNPGKKGTLTIEVGKTVPKGTAINLEMNGQPLHAIEGAPGLSYVFTPNPRYYILAGEFVEGQIIDTNQTGPGISLHLTERRGSPCFIVSDGFVPPH